MGRNPRVCARPAPRCVGLVLGAFLVGLQGCGAVKQDVHQYYSQMAKNYHEAEEKAKMDAIALEAESRGLLQSGQVHKYNRTRKELTRLKDWEARCAYQKERFEKAAKKLEPSLPPGASGVPDDPAPSPTG